MQHDFLWRTTRDLPERGRIGIFNRSYYEEVLIVRVHPEILHSEGLADAPHDDKTVWRDRYRSIVDLERHLHGNGTRIVKFYLHLSKEEQRKRFLERIDAPEKNWKFSLADVEERKFWKPYMKAYEECLGATSTRHAPWYVVPADDKENARLIVSRIVVDTLEELKMSYPKTSTERRQELLTIRDAARKMRSEVLSRKKVTTKARTMDPFPPSRSWREIVAPYARRRPAACRGSASQYGAAVCAPHGGSALRREEPSRAGAPACRAGCLAAGPPVCDPA